MHEIEMHEISEAFFPCWKAAGIHLSKQIDGGIQSWLRAHPYPPFLEHLSFRLGNLLFFVRVEDADGKVQGPGNPRGFITAAKSANGRACVLPMKKKLFGDTWDADMPGWGLLDADTRKPINPVTLITDQKIEMTPWEVHDMAVQVVRDYLLAGKSRSRPVYLVYWQDHATRMGGRALGEVSRQQCNAARQLAVNCCLVLQDEPYRALRVGRNCER
jgi:hypothetical protein